MVSTLSSDPTLSRAYVPWYFRMVPDDKQQAMALIQQIYQADKAKNVAVFALDNYDGKMSAKVFKESAQELEYPAPELFIGLNKEELLEKLNSNSWDALVMAGSSEDIRQIIGEIEIPVINAFLNLSNFIVDYKSEIFTKIKFGNLLDNTSWQRFENSFRGKYNTNPSPSLAYVYDGIMMATEAIEKFGPDSEAIRKDFKNLKYEGITGRIEFDKLGNRIY